MALGEGWATAALGEAAATTDGFGAELAGAAAGAEVGDGGAADEHACSSGTTLSAAAALPSRATNMRRVRRAGVFSDVMGTTSSVCVVGESLVCMVYRAAAAPWRRGSGAPNRRPSSSNQTAGDCPPRSRLPHGRGCR